MDYSTVQNISVTTTPQEIAFPASCRYFQIRNRGRQSVKIFLKGKDGQYNSIPLYIQGKSNRTFRFSTDSVKISTVRSTSSITLVGVFQ